MKTILLNLFAITTNVKPKRKVFLKRGIALATVLATMAPAMLFAQAPAISYTGPQTYVVNTGITTLLPANSGGAVAAPGYTGSSKSTVFSGTSYIVYARDATGNFYAFDYSNTSDKKLVKLSSTGSLLATLLTFLSRPEDIAVDASGNVFALDGSTIYKISSGGTSSTVGSFGGANGIALDAAGNIYVAAYSGSITSITEVPAAGGSNINIGSGLSYMTDVAVDANGNVYVCNDGDASIKKIPAGGGSAVTIASGFTSYSTSDLSNIIVDGNGNIFFTEANGGKVSEIPAGTNTAVQLSSGFFAPGGLAMDASGNLYISDNGTVYKLPLSGGYSISPALPAGLNFDSTTGSISGTPTALSPQTTYTITATNSSGSNTATVDIAVISSTDDNLSGLAISYGAFSPTFNPSTFYYTEEVPYSVSSVTLTPTADNSLETIKTYGGTIASGTTTIPIPLAPGLNTVHLQVFAQDGVTKNVYSVGITRDAASTDATLSHLTLNAGLLTPSFSPGVTGYTRNLVNGVQAVTIVPTTNDPNATIKVNGTTLASGATSVPIPVSVGTNTITISVTAEDGTTKQTYTMTLIRAGARNTLLSLLKLNKGVKMPVFKSNQTDYAVSVVNGVTNLAVTATPADPNATLLLNGTTALTSGAASAPIPLSVGPNIITVQVTAQNDTATRTYTLTVTRAASAIDNLASLKLSRGALSPAFTILNTNYTASVVNGVSSITVTPTAADPNATITVNNTPVVSGSPSGAMALSVGANIISIMVTAADGITNQTYTVTVTRAVGPVANYSPGTSLAQLAEVPALNDENIIVHQGITPNGDGINDFLQIDNIAQYPDNKLSIINRNGQLVFETKGYDNSSKLFDGHSNKNGKMQLPGTYYYQLDYTANGITKHKTGYLVLKY